MGFLKFLTFCLISVSVMAHEAPLAEDLYWFTETLKSSDMASDSVSKYLNPFRGRQSFRLGRRHAPWAGNYYPMADGGIAQRWQDGYYSNKFLTREQVKNMSQSGSKDLAVGN